MLNDEPYKDTDNVEDNEVLLFIVVFVLGYDLNNQEGDFVFIDLLIQRVDRNIYKVSVSVCIFCVTFSDNNTL